MSTNLEENRFSRDITNSTDKLQSLIDVVESKLENAILKAKNMSSTIEELSFTEDVSTITNQTIQYIENTNIKNTIDVNSFLSNGISLDRYNALALKYKDNTQNMLREFSDDSIGMGNNRYYIEDKDMVCIGGYNNSKFFITKNIDNLNSTINNNTNNSIVSAIVKNPPAYDKVIMTRLYSSIDEYIDSNSLIADAHTENNTLMKNYIATNRSTPTISIKRNNKVQNLEFGIVYANKSSDSNTAIITYGEKNDGSIRLLQKNYYEDKDTSTTYDNNSSMTNIVFNGNITIKDTGKDIEIGYSLSSNSLNMFENDLPEYEFQFSYDKDRIYIYLVKFKPYRIVDNTIPEMEFLRLVKDLSRLANLSESDYTKVLETDDTVIQMKKNDSSLFTTLQHMKNNTRFKEIMGIFRNKSIINDADIKNIRFIPIFDINLTIKDNGFFADDSIEIFNMRDRQDILTLPFKKILISSSDQVVQLNNIPLSNGNAVKLNTVKDTLYISNATYDKNSNRTVRSYSIKDMVSIHDEFIKSHIVDDNSVFYSTKITMHNDTVSDSNDNTSYVVQEIGKLSIVNDKLSVIGKYYTSVKDTILESKNIKNADELKLFINSKSMPFEYRLNDSSFRTISNSLSLYGDNIDGTPTNSSPLFFNKDIGLSINELEFKGIITIETTILKDIYNFDSIELAHIVKTDTTGILGYDNKDFENDIPMENQIVLDRLTLKYYKVIIKKNDKVTMIPDVTSIDVIDNSNASFEIYPIEGYYIKNVLVNGLSVSLVDETILNIKNIREDVYVEVITDVVPLPMYTIRIVESVNCTVIPNTEMVVSKGSNIQYTITPTEGYFIKSILANGIPKEIPVSGTFFIYGVTEDIDLSFVCEMIPLKLFNLRINNNIYGSTNPIEDTDHVIVEKSNIDITVSPMPKYVCNKYRINGVEKDMEFTNLIKILNVNSNVTIDTIIERVPLINYNIYVTRTDYCTIAEGTTTIPTVEEGSKEITIVPNVGYRFKTLRYRINGVTTPVDSLVNNKFLFTNIQSDIEVIAICEEIPPVVYTVTVLPADFCTISPNGIVNAIENTEPVFNITPSSGYRVVKYIINGIETTANGNMYKFPPITANMTFSAVCELIPPNYYNITVTQANCTVSPGSKSVIEHSNETFTININKGHKISIVTVNGVDIKSTIVNNTFTISDIMGNKNVVVECIPVYHNVVVTQAANLTISPSGTVPILESYNATFTIVPNSGYFVSKLIIDGVETTGSGAHTFNNVTEAHTISAIAELIPPTIYKVTINSGSNYTTVPNGIVNVEEGKNSPDIVFTPNSGYYIKSITVGGTVVYNSATVPTVSNNVNYTITNVRNDLSVVVVALAIPYYTVTVNSGANYTISPGTTTYVHGTTVEYTITPSSGYKLDTIVIDGVDVPANGQTKHTFTNIQKNYTIGAKVSLIPPTEYNVVTSAGAGGSVSPNGTTKVVEGNNITITAVPTVENIVKEFVLNGTVSPTDGTFGNKTLTIMNVRSDKTVVANFVIKKFDIAINSTLCTIQEGYEFQRDYNTNLVLTILPNPGHRFKQVRMWDILDPDIAVGGPILTGVVVNNILTLVGINSNKFLLIECEPIPIVYRKVTVVSASNCTYNKAVGDHTVETGTNFSIGVTPNTGYEISNSYVGTDTNLYLNPLGTTSPYTFQVNSDVTFVAVMRKKQYTISVTAPTNGTISPNTNQVVDHGTNSTFTITPNSGYLVDKLTIGGVVTTFPGTLTENGGTYTFSNVTSNKAISVTFKVKPIPKYTVTLVAGSGYTYTNTGNTFTVDEGTDFVVGVTINTNYLYNNLKVNNVLLYPVNTYTIRNIRTNQTVEVVVGIKPEKDYIWTPSVAFNASSGIVVNKEGSDYYAYRVLQWTYDQNPQYNNTTNSGAGAPYELLGKMYTTPKTPEWDSTFQYTAMTPKQYFIYNNQLYRYNWWTGAGTLPTTGASDGSMTLIGSVANPNWSSSIAYLVNDTCIYNKIAYTAQLNNTNKRPDLNNGVGKAWKPLGYLTGDISWVSTKNYLVNNLVYYNGFIYVAMMANNNKQPDLYGDLEGLREWKIIGKYN